MGGSDFRESFFGRRLEPFFTESRFLLFIKGGQQRHVLDGIFDLLAGQRTMVPSGTLHFFAFFQFHAQKFPNHFIQGQLLKPQDHGGPVRVKNVLKFKPVVSFEQTNIVVGRVEHLDRGSAFENSGQKGEVKAGRCVQNVSGFGGINLDKTEFFPEITKGIVFRIDSQYRRFSQVLRRKQDGFGRVRQ